jgi:multicomponent Na+:H+ antiporter subunit C
MTGLLAVGDAVSAAGAIDSGHYNYWLVIVLMMTGLYVVLSRGNMIKTVIGLNLFQVAVIMFYITMGKVAGGTAPIEIHALTVAQVEIADAVKRLSAGEAVSPKEVEQAIHHIEDAASQLPEGPVAESLTLAAAHAEGLLAQVEGPGNEAKLAEAVAALDYVLGQLVVYSNPLPHVLMLTAIVVGIATISLALALIVRINEAYDTIEEDEILALEGQL